MRALASCSWHPPSAEQHAGHHRRDRLFVVRDGHDLDVLGAFGGGTGDTADGRAQQRLVLDPPADARRTAEDVVELDVLGQGPAVAALEVRVRESADAL